MRLGSELDCRRIANNHAAAGVVERERLRLEGLNSSSSRRFASSSRSLKRTDVAIGFDRRPMANRGLIPTLAHAWKNPSLSV